MASTTFSGPVTSQNGFIGNVTGDVVGTIVVPTYTVATVPGTAPAGAVIFVSNGAAGQPILAYGSGSAWLRSDTGGALATS